ncbi:zinc-ribbon domain-containing protein [Virgisporangium ochraceum]|jgi:hypothetical protein|uniref:Zinc-ribbon 15 domain-containing protein n=1 Tax=Virgisporangium ochraceum TaxID=65505 RepID=A0A8J4A017_9ACTN|nr:zinc-ribbon domain-containing protein [Virgisporangium ochraceum]GIJ72052.1 hypothetical protein Voc01_069690 [Virgisporangium ochraceum]
MILFGYRQSVKELARLMMQCRSCGMQGWQVVYRVLTWFTLFFIPVLPLWVSRKQQCGTCGITQKVSKEEADAMVAHAANAPRY